LMDYKVQLFFIPLSVPGGLSSTSLIKISLDADAGR
jgi:hypothetical protein